MNSGGYKKLIVWQKSIIFISKIYEITSKFPKEEIFGLTSQIRRASISIPSNISEGSSRKSLKDYKHFMMIAYGSSLEIETQIEIAKNLKYISDKQYSELMNELTEIIRMLYKLSANN